MAALIIDNNFQKNIVINSNDHQKLYVNNNLVFEKEETQPIYPKRILINTGESYLDSGVTNSSNLKVEIKQHATVATSGVQTSVGGRSNGNTIFAIGSNGGLMYFNLGSGAVTTDVPLVGLQPITVIKDGARNFINGVEYEANAAVTFTGTHTLFVFAQNLAGSRNYITRMKLWYCKIWDSGTLVRDFTPVATGDVVDGLTAPSNCLYDKVTKGFFENKGTGTFGIEDA